MSRPHWAQQISRTVGAVVSSDLPWTGTTSELTQAHAVVYLYFVTRFGPYFLPSSTNMPFFPPLALVRRCSIWKKVDRRASFASGPLPLQKEGRHWFLLWLCQRDYSSSNAPHRPGKVELFVVSNPRGEVAGGRLVWVFFERRLTSAVGVGERRVSAVTLLCWGKLKHTFALSGLTLPRSLHNYMDKRIWQQHRMNFQVIFLIAKWVFPGLSPLTQGSLSKFMALFLAWLSL